MPDVGWQELLVIAVVAIIVVGPRELPQLMRTVGRWLARARRYARDFQYDMEQLGREAELDELRKQFDSFKKPMEGVRMDGRPEPRPDLSVEIEPEDPPAKPS